MLWRALGHIQRGFYIDVGACEPDAESVTAAFYERGWTGINIEPAPGAFQRLSGARTLDLNLPLACGETDGEAPFLLVDGGNGLSTLRIDSRETLEQAGWSTEPSTVRVRRLAGICQEHVHGDIHFLKIDVEGAEAEVLRGADFARWRPWIVVVEATRPNEPTPAFEDWEHLLLSARYTLAYADGLNRFYVAEERAFLSERLGQPPNVFDHYIGVKEARARHGLAASTAGLAASMARLAESERARDEAREEAHAECAALNARLLATGSRIAALEASLAGAAERLTILTAERDAAVQEMYESNRVAATTALERQSLIDQRYVPPPVAAPRDPSLPTVEALLASTSWRITAPLRAIVRRIRG